MSIAELPRLTADDLLTMPDGESFELVAGQLLENRMGQESSWVAGEIFGRLRQIVQDAELGWVFPENTSYQCFPWEPQRVRKPDTSFIRLDRLPDGPTREGHLRLHPDLAVEVVSPHDTYYEMQGKIADFLEAGVRLVWVINPDRRDVTVHTPEHPDSPRVLREQDELSGGSVVPGFRCVVGDLFPRKRPTTSN